MKTITTDVLIIGAGAAGIRAAIAASEAGVDVVMVTKAPPTEGGSTFSPVSKGWGIQALMGDERTEQNLEAFYDDIMRVGLGRCDPKLVRILVEESGPRLEDLMSYGMRFRKDGEGRYARVTGCFSDHKRAFLTESAGNIDHTFKRMLKRGDIKMVTGGVIDLSIADGACWGGWVLTEAEDVIQIKARSTVLATGGGAAIYEDHLVSDDLVGDGYALACRAGAKLVNLEFIQFMLGLKAEGTRQFFPLSRLGVHGVLEDTQGRNVLEASYHDAEMLAKAVEERKTHFPFSCRDHSHLVDIAVAAERRHGRSVRWAHRSGSEPSGKSEVVHVAHAFNGGVVIDDKAESTVRGLFAAGEVAAGPHGADRIGGCMMTATQVFGERAGRFAAKRVKEVSGKHIPEIPVPQYLAANKPFRRRGDTEPVSNIEWELKRAMTRHVSILRSEEGLIKSRRKVRDLQKRLDTLDSFQRVSPPHRFRLRNLIQVALLIIGVAISRRQSLGPHYREDYPPSQSPLFPAGHQKDTP